MDGDGAGGEVEMVARNGGIKDVLMVMVEVEKGSNCTIVVVAVVVKVKVKVMAALAVVRGVEVRNSNDRGK